MSEKQFNAVEFKQKVNSFLEEKLSKNDQLAMTFINGGIQVLTNQALLHQQEGVRKDLKIQELEKELKDLRLKPTTKRETKKPVRKTSTKTPKEEEGVK